jgi:hypothetical protein
MKIFSIQIISRYFACRGEKLLFFQKSHNINTISSIINIWLLLTMLLGGSYTFPTILAAESVSLTTYFPAPVGIYDRLRLTPRSAINETSCDIGRLYVNADAGNVLYFCRDDGIDGAWGTLDAIWAQTADDIHLIDTTDPELKHVGIGTLVPELKLSLDYDGGIIASGTDGDPGNASLLTSSGGTRFFWYLKKAAIRGGHVTSTQWEDMHVGKYSVAFGNDTAAEGLAATASGGFSNIALADYTTVSGGQFNTAVAPYGTVNGGSGNSAQNTHSYVGGGNNNQAQGLYSTIAGGVSNTAGNSGSTIIGGTNNIVNSVYGTIGGGTNNIATGDYGTIAGGMNNNINGLCGTIGGGELNAIKLGAGTNAPMLYGAIGGGYKNEIYGTETTVTDTYASAIKGGKANTVQGNYSFIGGGIYNQITGDYSTMGGGYNNTISANYAFIGGGMDNTVSADYGVIAAGTSGTVSGIGSFIGSGVGNQVTGQYSTIPSGYSVQINGDHSWASGQFIQVDGDHTFVWGHAWSGVGSPVTITQNNAFIIYSQTINGGSQDARLGIGTIDPQERVHVDGNVLIDNGSIYLTTITDQTGDTLDWSSPGGVIGKDLAEIFPVSETVTAGDLLIVDDSRTDFTLKKSRQTYDQRVVGIASASPAMVFQGHELVINPQPISFNEGSFPPVALTGQVQVKVSTENGPIQAGDLLTSSSTPGHAMRADKDPQKSFGCIVGKALESFNGGPHGETTGTIVIFVSLQ